MQTDSKPFMIICLVGSWVASSDKALCLINTLTASLSGQSHSSTLLKWLRKSLWPLGDWYSNFPPASQMIRPEMKQTKCDRLSLLLFFSSFPLISFSFSPFSLLLLPPVAHQRLLFPLSFFISLLLLLTLHASQRCNIRCILLVFFPPLCWSLKITLRGGSADFCFLHQTRRHFDWSRCASDSNTREMSLISM